jgi:isopentenyl phosphate kinase
MKPTCYVIKLGGSVITYKQGRYALRRDVIALIARVLKARQPVIGLPVVLVFGGGSFGNVAPTDYRIFERPDGMPSANLPMMTSVMFSMLSDIVQIFIEHSLRVYPFQAGALLSVGEHGHAAFNSRPLLAAMVAGFMPVLTGDLLLREEQEAVIVSSDNLVPLLAVDFDVRRALYYSDVEGVHDQANHLVRWVSNANAAQLEGCVGGSCATDLTGGMHNKFMQQRELARLGVISEVLSFDHFDRVHLSLSGVRQFGTLFLNE